jgi:ankyrin repeat protein
MSPQSTGRQWDRLVQVIARGDLQTIKQLEYEDIDVLMKNSRGATGLMYAAQANNQFAHQVLEYFLEHGSDVDDVDRAGWTALFYAAQAGEELSVRTLLEKNADRDVKDNDDRTPLHLAAATGDLAVLKYLLQAGLPSNERDAKGWVPVFYAAQEGKVEAVKMLMSTNEINIKSCVDLDGRSVLHVGAEAGDKKVVELLLLELKAHLEGKDHAGRTPVLVAVMNGHEHVAVFLAEQKANLFAKPKDGRTAPVIADEAGMSAFKFRVILAQAEMRKAKH